MNWRRFRPRRDRASGPVAPVAGGTSLQPQGCFDTWHPHVRFLQAARCSDGERAGQPLDIVVRNAARQQSIPPMLDIKSSVWLLENKSKSVERIGCAVVR
jgi:hypothetical protein